jgi:hypothetical protein
MDIVLVGYDVIVTGKESKACNQPMRRRGKGSHKSDTGSLLLCQKLEKLSHAIDANELQFRKPNECSQGK